MTRTLLALLIVVAALIVVWNTGRLDPALNHAGLSDLDCRHGSFGEALCADFGR